MRKLLLLLPLMALASCSGEYDLMSNRRFEMTCPWKGTGTQTVTIDPELPKAFLMVMRGPLRTLDLIDASPTQIRLTEKHRGTPHTYWEIDRETEEVSVDGNLLEGCTFKSF